MFLWNVGIYLQVHMALLPRSASTASLQREPKYISSLNVSLNHYNNTQVYESPEFNNLS
jgi:hypothetical protein